VYRVERSLYVEQVWTEERFREVEAIELDWRGTRYRIPRPAELGDVHFVWLEGLEGEEQTVELVLVRRTGWLESLRGAVGLREPVVHESTAVAEPIGPAG